MVFFFLDLDLVVPTPFRGRECFVAVAAALPHAIAGRGGRTASPCQRKKVSECLCVRVSVCLFVCVAGRQIEVDDLTEGGVERESQRRHGC